MVNAEPVKFAPAAGPGVEVNVPRLTKVELVPGSPGGTRVTLNAGDGDEKVIVEPPLLRLTPAAVQAAQLPAPNVPVVAPVNVTGSALAVIMAPSQITTQSDPVKISFLIIFICHTSSWTARFGSSV
jgi:hypothetical protein